MLINNWGLNEVGQVDATHHERPTWKQLGVDSVESELLVWTVEMVYCWQYTELSSFDKLRLKKLNENLFYFGTNNEKVRGSISRMQY